MLRKHVLKPGDICPDCGYENVGKGFDVHWCEEGYIYEDGRDKELLDEWRENVHTIKKKST